MPRALLLFAVLLWLAGCGFQLRGDYDLPPEMARTYISGLELRDPLRIELLRQLRAGGVEVVTSLDQATAQLRILSKRDAGRPLSIGSDGKVREYEISTTVQFDVLGSSTGFKREPVTLTVIREYAYDPTGVLGKSSEATMLRAEMQRELAQTMMLHLQAD